MNIRYIQTKNVSSWTNTAEYIIVHHSWWVESSDVRILTGNWWREVSCHYYISQSWVLYQFATHDQITWHAWQSQRDWKYWMNNYSIGIELESLDWNTYTDIQTDLCIQLIKNIQKQDYIPHYNILRHWHVAPDRKRDVWPKFYEEFWSWEWFQNLFLDKGMDKTQILTLKWIIWQYKMLWTLDEENRSFYSAKADEIRRFLEENEVDTSDT